MEWNVCTYIIYHLIQWWRTVIPAFSPRLFPFCPSPNHATSDTQLQSQPAHFCPFPHLSTFKLSKHTTSPLICSISYIPPAETRPLVF